MSKELKRIGPMAIFHPHSSNKRKRMRFSRSFKMSKSYREVIKLGKTAKRVHLMMIRMSLTFSCKRMISLRIKLKAATEFKKILERKRRHDTLKST